VQDGMLAIVPSGADFPVDWEPWRDIVSPKRSQYENIGDILYRDKFSIDINNALASVQKDERGLYRLLTGQKQIHLNRLGKDSGTLEIVYDGNPERLTLSNMSHNLPAPKITQTNGQTKLLLNLEDATGMHIQMRLDRGSLKLRKMSWK